MNLFNKKLVAQHITRYDFPSGEELEVIKSNLKKLRSFIKDQDLNRTQEIKIQGAFLVRVFSDILGYTHQIDNNDSWDLEQHPKTEIDSQIADGGLGYFSKEGKEYKAVIELKDARTSLDKKQSGRAGKLTPVEQAFNYLNKFDGCQWAIVSNFREIRLYSKARGQGFYEKFEITDLDNELEFRRFYFLLNKTNLIDEGGESLVEQLVKNTTAQEESITKQFYSQYKEIRLKLLQHLFDNNPDVDRLVLVEKTQKVLDRLIFIMVCEDSSTLLPAQIIKKTYEQAFQSFALSDSDQRVWTEFKGLFHAIDKGNKRVLPPINAYNGGLFKADEILDNLIIKDDIWENLVTLTHYDFESDLNVNVLGHIFEQSISDLEEIRESVTLATEDGNDLVTEDEDKIVLEQNKSSLVEKKGKRKKMGIFYTPEYITKFIVENTVGRYLEENPDKLESLKILDPACGSGAFLNQAHSFLLNEYKVRTELHQLEKQQKGEALNLWDTNLAENDKSILLNNLFGVDLSPESVEITKLALWLKTARSTEPLQNLDQNIKCGNSIINDPQFAGERSFDWNKEFSEIMNNGGFDVIVGNPPYVRSEIIKDQSEYLSNNFNVFQGKNDLYVYFFEQSLKLLKPNGLMAFIVSSKFTKTNYARKLRQYLLDNSEIIDFIDFNDLEIFNGVTAYPAIIILRKKKKSVENIITYRSVSTLPTNGTDITNVIPKMIPQKDMSDSEWIFKTAGIKKILSTKSNLSLFSEVLGKPGVGIKTGFNDAFILDKSISSSFKKQLGNGSQIQKYLFGKDISRYHFETNNEIVFPYSGSDDKFTLIEEKEIDPFLSAYLDQFKEKLESRAIIKEGLINKSKNWYEYQQINKSFNLDRSYIVYPNVSLNSSFAVVKDVLVDMTAFFIELTNESMLAYVPILNSTLIDKLHKEISIERRGGYRENKTQYIEQTLLPNLNQEDAKLLIDFYRERVNLEEKYRGLIQSAVLLILSEYKELEVTRKINNFWKLGWNEFIDYLDKSKVIISLEKKEKLMNWFRNKQKTINEIVEQISSLDRTIDKKVYKLYSLTADEIKLVENT